MEKDTYETFEFITPSSPNSAEINPLFVLQEDGTILSVNREVQYVTQTADGKENVQPCTVFDVSSQRYYVDVNNTTELITIPDQFVTPTDEDSINSYLIQPEPTAVSEPMETDQLIESNPETFETDVDATTISKSVHTGYTEITINNDQYQILEQRGWILLECYDKIFILNTLGLHDITENEKLVTKLKSEVQAFNVTTQLEELTERQIDVKIENQSRDLNNVESKDLEKLVNCENDEIQELEVESVTEDNLVANPVELDTEADNQESNSTDTPEDTQSVKYSQEEEISSPTHDDCETDTCNTLKIKTKYIFTDVPPKIYLGKTAAGKKLFAKITKSKLNRIKNNKNLNISCEKKIENYCTLTESQFISIVQDSFRDSPHVNDLNVTEAEAIITQLLKISQIKQAIVGHNIVFTKISISTDAEGRTTNQQRPIIVTGVINETDGGKGKFVYVPKMLQTLQPTVSDVESDKVRPDSNKTEPNRMINIFHIHIAESNIYGKPPNQTIQITKRKLSLNVLNDAKKRHPDPVYACGACAAVFKTETTLKEHQENICFADDVLTIDTDKINVTPESYSTIEVGKKKLYACTQCEVKFTRLFNCQKHVKTHNIPNQNPDSDSKSGTEDNKTPKKVYKCSMCPSTYFHPSSLSKHIVKMHIHV